MPLNCYSVFQRLLVGKLSVLFILFSFPSIAGADQTLKIVPEQCVALTQGQNCFVDATLTWTSNTIGDYCLFSSQQVKPLMCWLQKKEGKFSNEFSDNKSIVFTLKTGNKNQVKSTKILKVTWVHQKRGQPRMWWRIF